MRKKESFNPIVWFFRLLWNIPFGETADAKARLKLSRESHLPPRPAASEVIREHTSDLFKHYYRGELSEKMEFWELAQALVKSEYIEKYRNDWRINIPANLFTWKVEPPTKEELIQSLAPYLEKIDKIKKKYGSDLAGNIIPDCYDIDRDGREIIDMKGLFER